MATLISFDIDGTLVVGDPPGLITLDMVRQAQASGYLIGSCSDRTIGFQQTLWQQYNITVDFMVLKHQLAAVRARFEADVYYHVGDTDIDRFFADRAGFHFIQADAAAYQVWAPKA